MFQATPAFLLKTCLENLLLEDIRCPTQSAEVEQQPSFEPDLAFPESCTFCQQMAGICAQGPIPTLPLVLAQPAFYC